MSKVRAGSLPAPSSPRARQDQPTLGASSHRQALLLRALTLRPTAAPLLYANNGFLTAGRESMNFGDNTAEFKSQFCPFQHNLRILSNVLEPQISSFTKWE